MSKARCAALRLRLAPVTSAVSLLCVQVDYFRVPRDPGTIAPAISLFPATGCRHTFNLLRAMKRTHNSKKWF
jgi:hypothetical protein